jgi:hypothetical protein
MRYVVCVNTCLREPYISARAQLERRPWFQNLLKDKDAEIFFVYADPSLSKPELKGNDLFLPCADSYDHLADKTFAMINYFSARGGFEYLVKMDDVVFSDRRFDDFLLRRGVRSLCSGSYRGVAAFVATPHTLHRWLQIKGLRIDGDERVAIYKPFYSGNVYAMSVGHCRQLVRQEEVFRYFSSHLAGMEDLAVGVASWRVGLPLRDKLQLLIGYCFTLSRYAFSHFFSKLFRRSAPVTSRDSNIARSL